MTPPLPMACLVLAPAHPIQTEHGNFDDMNEHQEDNENERERK